MGKSNYCLIAFYCNFLSNNGMKAGKVKCDSVAVIVLKVDGSMIIAVRFGVRMESGEEN